MIEPDVDEDLPQPPQRNYPRVSRPILALVVMAAAAALFVGLVVNLRSDPGDRSSTATRTVTPHPVVAPPLTDFYGHPRNDPAMCPAGGSCTNLDTVPAQVLQAVRGTVPGARPRYATTVLIRVAPVSRLRFRQLNATAGSARVTLLVRQPNGVTSPRSEADDDGRTRHVFVLTRSHGYVVQVQVDGPVASTPELAAVRRLAADARLLVAR